jgi:hypothetical protein
MYLNKKSNVFEINCYNNMLTDVDIIKEFEAKAFSNDLPLALIISDIVYFKSKTLIEYFSTKEIWHLSVDVFESATISSELFYDFKNINSLRVGFSSLKHPAVVPPIDLSQFPKLKELITVSINNFTNIHKTNLESIELQPPFDSFGSDFTKNTLPNSLTNLLLNRQRISSLKGIENLKNLKSLVLYNMKKLTDVSAIGGLKKLETLRIEECPNISFTNLPINESLQNLSITGKIQSIQFLDKLPNVKDFYFSKSIKNLDLSPLNNRVFERLVYK